MDHIIWTISYEPYYMVHMIWSGLDGWTTSVLVTDVGVAKIVTVPRNILICQYYT